MSNSHKGKIPWNYGITMPEEYKEKRSGENHPMYGLRGELSPNFGLTRSDETKRKMSIIKIGTHVSDETKRKISASTRGKSTGKQQIVKCPHCQKEGGRNLMSRYHFNNCQFI